MKKIDDLLEKYFAGTTSLQEEKELKAYFENNPSDTLYRRYAPLFAALRAEKEIKYPDKEIKKNVSAPLYRRISIIALSAVAACLLILFVVRDRQLTNDYLIVRGKRINNPEMARQFSNERLEKSMDIIHRSLASHKDNAMVQEKLKEIEEQIKIKK